MELFLNIVPVGLFVLTAGILGVKVQDFDFARGITLAIVGFILFVILANSGLKPESLPAIIFGIVMFIALVAYGKFPFVLAILTIAIWGTLFVYVRPPLETKLAQALDYVERGGLKD